MGPSSTLGEPELKSEDQIIKMRDSCRLAAKILKSCENIVKVIGRSKVMNYKIDFYFRLGLLLMI